MAQALESDGGLFSSSHRPSSASTSKACSIRSMKSSRPTSGDAAIWISSLRKPIAPLALHDQLDQWVAASEFAERRSDQTSDPESARDAQTDDHRCQANIADLYGQIEQQSQERDERLRQQQETEAKLAQIRHQRRPAFGSAKGGACSTSSCGRPGGTSVLVATSGSLGEEARCGNPRGGIDRGSDLSGVFLVGFAECGKCFPSAGQFVRGINRTPAHNTRPKKFESFSLSEQILELFVSTI